MKPVVLIEYFILSKWHHRIKDIILCCWFEAFNTFDANIFFKASFIISFSETICIACSYDGSSRLIFTILSPFLNI